MNAPVKLGQTLALTIKRLGINGEGIAYFKGLTIFISNALPGENVLARITKIPHNHAEAEVVKLCKASKFRTTPPCSVYETCGGCHLQHLAYPQQLEFKKDILKQALRKFQPAGYQTYRFLETIGDANPWHYRNKAQFQLRNFQGNIHAGLYQSNSHQLIPITHCNVQHKVTQKIMNFIVELLNRHSASIYNERKRTGNFRTIMVRVGVQTNEVQVVFITANPQFPNQTSILSQLTRAYPEIVSIMQNIQPRKTSEIYGEETRLLWGKEVIQEKLGMIHFELSARSFFQLNPKQTEILYEKARETLDLQTGETLIDAYCGVGTIGLSMAHFAKEVRGMDRISSAIQNARKNAENLGLTNTRYEIGTAEKWIPKWLKEGFFPDALIVDPPRTGLDSKLLQTILKFPPKKMVYISCNASTLAKDLVVLAQKFQVVSIQSIDLFPQTARVEAVVKLVKK